MTRSLTEKKQTTVSRHALQNKDSGSVRCPDRAASRVEVIRFLLGEFGEQRFYLRWAGFLENIWKWHSGVDFICMMRLNNSALVYVYVCIDMNTFIHSCMLFSVRWFQQYFAFTGWSKLFCSPWKSLLLETLVPCVEETEVSVCWQSLCSRLSRPAVCSSITSPFLNCSSYLLCMCMNGWTGGLFRRRMKHNRY